jgi:hypothetical protein
LPVVLYGCEVWSLTFREERRLRVSENRVLRRVFGPKRDEVTGEWRKLHNEEVNDLYSDAVHFHQPLHMYYIQSAVSIHCVCDELL